MTGPFVCRQCGDEWDQDPRLAVPCGVCGAKVGQWCGRPSEHRGGRSGFIALHAGRKRAAWELQPCSCLARWDAEHGTPETAVQGSLL